MSIVIWLVEINILFYSILFYYIVPLLYKIQILKKFTAPVVTFSELVSAVANNLHN
jgi:hypothetical protein